MTSDALFSFDSKCSQTKTAALAARPWYAIHVKAQHEGIAVTGLRGKGFEYFAPTYRCRRRWSDRIKTLDQPLFPGYIFSRFNISDRINVLNTPGIADIVGIGRIPQAVDDHEIARIQTIVRSGVLAYPWPCLHQGQSVVITHGPLTGLEGLLLSAKNQHRLVVSITMLKRSVATEIDRDCVEPVSAPLRHRRPPAIAHAASGF